MTILVTGATGRLGGLTVRHLLDRVPAAGLAVSVRDPGKAAALAERGVEVRTGDFDDPENLVRVFDGADKLLVISTEGPEEQRMHQHHAAVAVAERAGVGHILYTSVSDADTSPLGLARVHKATEERIRQSGIPFTFLRNGMYHENYTVQLPQAVERGALVTSAGDGRLAGAARDDFALAAAVALTTAGHEGAVYELTGSTPWTFDELAAAAAEVSGKPVRHENVSDETLTGILLGAGLPAFAAELYVDIYANIRAGALAEVRPDLEKLIGRPSTPLVDAVRAAL